MHLVNIFKFPYPTLQIACPTPFSFILCYSHYTHYSPIYFHLPDSIFHLCLVFPLVLVFEFVRTFLICRAQPRLVFDLRLVVSVLSVSVSVFPRLCIGAPSDTRGASVSPLAPVFPRLCIGAPSDTRGASVSPLAPVFPRLCIGAPSDTRGASVSPLAPVFPRLCIGAPSDTRGASVSPLAPVFPRLCIGASLTPAACALSSSVGGRVCHAVQTQLERRSGPLQHQ